ncbi:GYF domain-containing protein [Kamptonema cortianum]|nr:GYF domain-containing protein [Geitlerinema splendidum]MDK3158678.1 GYF domain-containing protein [Kamptonema cortianum]
MEGDNQNAEWYYVGHYGQLGPLTLQQMAELSSDGVIDTETYVWRPGMADWLQAGVVPALGFERPAEQPPPPPTPGTRTLTPQTTATRLQSPYGSAQLPYGSSEFQYRPVSVSKSDKSRVIAGLLNALPGFGRFYLGYVAHGILQFFTSMCGIGLIWSWIDGLYILAGGVKYDGYGRELSE